MSVTGTRNGSPDLTLLHRFHFESLSVNLESVLEDINRDFSQRQTTISELVAVRDVLDSLVTVPTWLHDMLTPAPAGRSPALIEAVMRRGHEESSMFRNAETVRVMVQVWLEYCIHERLRFPGSYAPCSRISAFEWRLSEPSIRRFIRKLLTREAERLSDASVRSKSLPYLNESDDSGSLLDTVGSVFYEVASSAPEDEIIQIAPELEVPHISDWRVQLIDMYICDINLPLATVVARLPGSVSSAQAEDFRAKLRAHTKFPAWAHEAILRFRGMAGVKYPKFMAALRAAAPDAAVAREVDSRPFQAVLTAWLKHCIVPMIAGQSPPPCVKVTTSEYGLSPQQATQFLIDARTFIVNS